MNLEKIKNFIVRFYAQAVIGVLLLVLGVWIGQNFTFNLPFNTKKSANSALFQAPLISLSNRATPAGVDVDFNQFWAVWDKLTKEYLNKKDLDQKKLLYGAISGLVNAVGDPYTVFLDPSANKDFSSQLNGTYEGVGIEIGSKDGKMIVVSPIEGSPASAAGVLAGDLISQINGKDTSTLAITDAVKEIRGAAGTSVNIVLSRAGKSIPVTLKRAKITIKSVTLADKGDGIALIRINQFGDKTQEEWDSAINKFATSGFKKLILDLRNNPGGRLDTAIYIANEFVSKGTTIVQEEDSAGARQKFTGERDGRLQNITPIVLVNKGSASASEILSGALRDLKKAQLVGETTFGKGVVQRVEDLNAGAGLHITVAKWLTPNGTWVNGVGLKPDVEIKLSDDDIKNNKDTQLIKALELAK